MDSLVKLLSRYYLKLMKTKSCKPDACVSLKFKLPQFKIYDLCTMKPILKVISLALLMVYEGSMIVLNPECRQGSLILG